MSCYVVLDAATNAFDANKMKKKIIQLLIVVFCKLLCIIKM